MVRHIRARLDVLDRLAEQHGLPSRYALAHYLDLSQPTVNRVLDGKALPGPKFIAAVMGAFGVQFCDVFELIDEQPGREICEAGS